MKVGRITRVRLISPVPMGDEATPHQHLATWHSDAHQGTKIDGRRITIHFESDDRFLSVKWEGQKTVELIPLANVAGIACEVVPEVSEPTTKKGAK